MYGASTLMDVFESRIHGNFSTLGNSDFKAVWIRHCELRLHCVADARAQFVVHVVESQCGSLFSSTYGHLVHVLVRKEWTFLQSLLHRCKQNKYCCLQLSSIIKAWLFLESAWESHGQVEQDYVLEHFLIWCGLCFALRYWPLEIEIGRKHLSTKKLNETIWPLLEVLVVLFINVGWPKLKTKQGLSLIEKRFLDF